MIFVRRSTSVFATVCLFLILAPLSSGCRDKRDGLPKTYKVTGTVVHRGGAPIAGGAVQFRHMTDTSFSVSGDIEKDGSFTLSTLKDTKKVAGVPEGEYQVSIISVISADQRASPAIALKETYRVEAKDNHFAIEIAAPAKRP